MLSRHSFDGLLDDVVPVLIFHAFEDMAVKFLDDACLLIDQDMFKSLGKRQQGRWGLNEQSFYLLHHPTAIHLSRECHNMALHLICESFLLSLVAMFEELLDDVVTKYVCHQLNCVWLNFPKHLLFLVRVGCLQFQLDESRSVLIATEFNNMTIDVLFPVSLKQQEFSGRLTFSSKRLLVLLFVLKSSSSGLRIT